MSGGAQAAGSGGVPRRGGRPRRSRARVWAEFLGSMNLAITLLVALAIASAIGTVLQQGQPYQDYLIKFGPFWFEVFRLLGLYDVYTAGWFVAVLAFLVVSTTVCIARNAPAVLADMRRWRLGVRARSLRGFHHRREWATPAAPAEAVAAAEAALTRAGYAVRRRVAPDHAVVAGVRGRWGRLGYLLTHVAIVVICVGGLMDGNLRLKLSVLLGQLRVETRDIPASQVPPESRLGPGNFAFRGSVTIPEGTRANIVFLRLGEGYLVQELPFTVEVREFRIEHYETGQPKSFESDLVIYEGGRKVLERTIAVNHPLVYKGHAIYQASFGDGGSRLRLRAWPLAGKGRPDPVPIEGRVFDRLRIQTPAGPRTLELTDFRLFNIQPVADDPAGKRFRNFGPSFTYRLRDPAGEAREYQNYMQPVPVNGRLYLVSGMRETPAEPFRFLHIPLDRDGGPGRFMRLRALVWDDAAMRRIAQRLLAGSLEGTPLAQAAREGAIAESMVRLVAAFRVQGFDGVAALVRARVPAAERDKVMEAYVRVLQNLLGAAYLEALAAEGRDPAAPLAEDEIAWFDDAVAALAGLHRYGAPIYLQLVSFEHREASGLQITKAPGKSVVYLGSAMLVVGTFLMFYLPRRRAWVWLEPVADGGTQVLLAGTGLRHQAGYGREFERLAALVARALPLGGGSAGEKA